MSHKITFATFPVIRRVFQAVDGRPPPARIAGFRQPDRQEVSMAQAQPTTALRQRMLDDMRLRNMAATTRQIYVRSVANFSAYHGRSPDELTLEDVRDYQLHLVARGLKASSICQGTVKLMGLVEASRRDGPGPCPHRGARPVRGSVAGAPSRPPVLRVLPGRRATRAGTVRGGTSVGRPTCSSPQ